MECREKENLRDCACTYPGCSRKGICRECLKYHLDKGEVPACFFSKEAEKTYDRTIEHFCQDWKGRK